MSIVSPAHPRTKLPSHTYTRRREGGESFRSRLWRGRIGRGVRCQCGRAASCRLGGRPSLCTRRIQVCVCVCVCVYVCAIPNHTNAHAPLPLTYSHISSSHTSLPHTHSGLEWTLRKTSVFGPDSVTHTHLSIDSIATVQPLSPLTPLPPLSPSHEHPSHSDLAGRHTLVISRMNGAEKESVYLSSGDEVRRDRWLYCLWRRLGWAALVGKRPGMERRVGEEGERERESGGEKR